VAAHHRRHLGVEQRARHFVHAQVEDFEILARGVEDLEHLGIGHQFVERGQVDAFGQGVDRRRFVRASDLGQAELGPVGALAHEFGIDRDVVGAR
jgi:hypothetical protein